MKNASLSLIIYFILCSNASVTGQESLSGVWRMEQDNTEIEIKEKSGVYEGRIFASDNAKAAIGSLILKDVKLNGGKWKGKLFSPKKKEWFDAIIERDKNQLLVTVKSGWTSKTLKWIKK